MFVAYTAKIRGIIECWQCYGVCEVYNGIVSKVLGDGWLNPRILSVQSLEAHQREGLGRLYNGVGTFCRVSLDCGEWSRLQECREGRRSRIGRQEQHQDSDGQ